MKYTKQTTREPSPKILKGVQFQEIIKRFSTSKRIGGLHLSFLSFRLNSEAGFDVATQSHSPPHSIRLFCLLAYLIYSRY